MTRGMRIFLDANILFSAAKSDGAIRSLIIRLLDEGHDCRADGYVIDEARRNLVAKDSRGLQRLDELISRLTISTTAPATTCAEGHGLPEKDQWVLAAAIALKCDSLVTGDRTHFGKLYGRTIAGVRIDSPRSLFDRLVQESRPRGR
jgi:predicted nucleic acid-binding protein